MPARRVVFTPAAEADLNEIWFEIALDNIAAADRTIDHIRKRTEQLSVFPELGRVRPDVAEDVRSLVVGSYIVLYRIGADVADIVRIVHGARDLTALF
jgi:toxin ParE1/3/4